MSFQITYMDAVDIFGIVYEMRKERVWMVQTEQQYICIHQVMNNPLMLRLLSNRTYSQRG